MRSLARFLFAPALLFSIALPTRAAENAIDFVETFALADDRGEALKQLVPGTEDFYYYHALHAQNEGRYNEVESYLEPWKQRHGETSGYQEIVHRQALLRYPEQPQQSLAYLKRVLGLRFNHQKQVTGVVRALPTRLDPEAISWAAYFETVEGTQSVSELTESGIDTLVRADQPLSDAVRREVLARLRWPDYPRLVGLVAADLRTRESRGFGEFEIHRRLLPNQLDSLETLIPALTTNPAFVNTRLAKLAPSNDVDWRNDAAARAAYLERLWIYVDTLPETFNSLKAHTLYRLLDHHRREGNYDFERFRTYVELPRQVGYNAAFSLSQRSHLADLNADFAAHTALPPVRQDEELVRDFLLRLFENADSYEAWKRFIREDYLQGIFAEAKLAGGKGDAQRWFSLLSPGRVQQLRERVDLEFALTNESQLTPADAVTLDLFVKNVDRLMVKVYELNPLNFYLEEKREINTDLNLDGLIANSEKTYEYDEAPIRRVRRTFTFDELANRRGIFVIEFIGNGQSSRALIRKGELQYLAQPTAAGIVVTVLNQDNTPAKTPAVWLNRREYRPNPKTGRILVPYTSGDVATDSQIILTAEDNAFASLESLEVPTESYRLSADFALAQEALLPGVEATIAVNSSVWIGETSTTTGLLEKATLTLESVDENGIASTESVSDFELFDDRESTHTFRVPEGLRQLTATLTATMGRVASAGEPYTLSASRTFSVNALNDIDRVSDLHLSQIDGGWYLEHLGKTGEPLADRTITFSFYHRDFQRPIVHTLRTSANGRIALGALRELRRVEVQADSFRRDWDLQMDSHSGRSRIHQAVGQPVQIPVSEIGALTPENFAVFEERNGSLVSDVFSEATFERGLITIEELTPGDYTAIVRTNGREIRIQIADSTATVNDYALGEHRHLQILNATPLQIESLATEGDAFVIQLANADEFTRVHLKATHFFSPFAFSPGSDRSPTAIQRGLAESRYLSGRDIGDEYRYILERRDAEKFPGNQLARPALILNPWVIDDTQTELQVAQDGEDYKKSEGAQKSKRAPEAPMSEVQERNSRPQAPTTPDYTFLAKPAPVLYNLSPDKNGRITIPKAALSDRQFVTVTALNADNTVTRSISLPEDPPTAIRDLRLKVPLNPAQHFTQQQRVTVLGSGESLTIADVRASEVQTYDTLASVYATMAAMNPNATATEFRFLVDWPSLDEVTKRQRYSKYACHELNFFLSRRDIEFFQTVVQPYLANKRDRTFMDEYLLEADLTRFLEPWQFGQLNIVERILLGKRLGGDRVTSVARHVRELQAMTPVNPQAAQALYFGALRGRGMDRNDIVGAAGRVMFNGGGRLQDSSRMAYADGFAFESDSSDPFAAPAPVAAEAITLGAKIRTKDQVGRRELGLMELGDLEEARQQVRQNFQKLESTKEWAENHYYHVPIVAQNGDFISINPFWLDYATWDGEGGFYSRHFPAATSRFAEMALALAVLDLPFVAEKPEIKVEENALTLTAKGSTLVFHQELEVTPPAEGESTVMVSQNFARTHDRYRFSESGERSDKFVSDEFLVGEPYLAQVVVTNPTSTLQNLALLLQIPQGALPINGSEYTESRPIQLAPFSTQTEEVHFYFPMSSVEEQPFAHYPVHVSREAQPIAWTDPTTFKVVETLSVIDQTSWDYLSQHGSEDEVMTYLETANLQRTDLSQVAWRVRESEAFFTRVTEWLQSRQAFDATLWSYGLHHDQPALARQFLLHQERFLQQCGLALESPLVSIDPVERAWYQHLEYQPLINARAHPLGRDRTILNDKFHPQYHAAMKRLSYHADLSSHDAAGVAYYLFLQDRVNEALAWLEKVDAAQVDTDIQLDYLQAYAAMYRSEPQAANEIAAKYADYPADRWRERFAAIRTQVAEIGGEAEEREVDPADREAVMGALAESEPSFEIGAEGQTVQIDYRNLEEVRVNYYRMDLEFLFSTDPFVANDSGRFRYIQPNHSATKKLPPNAMSQRIPLPEAFANANVLVEIIGAGQRKQVAIYANQLDVTVSENYGRLTVRNPEQRPLSTTYVKVYAKFQDGRTQFFKDGYTDLRGRFDYTSLNSNELDHVERFSLLILSEAHGAMVKEVDPPAR